MDIGTPLTNNRRDAIIGVLLGAFIALGMIALGVYLLKVRWRAK